MRDNETSSGPDHSARTSDPATGDALPEADLLGAITAGRLDSVTSLLAHSRDVTCKHIQSAARLPTVDVLDAVLAADPSSIEQDSARRRVITTAVKAGSFQVTSRLLALGTQLEDFLVYQQGGLFLP